MPLPNAPAGSIYLSAAALVRATLTPRPETPARNFLSDARSSLFGPELQHSGVRVEIEAGKPAGAVRVSVWISSRVPPEGEAEGAVLRSLAAFSTTREAVMEVSVKREDPTSGPDAALAERVRRLLAAGGYACRVVSEGELWQEFLSGEHRSGLFVGTGGERGVMRLLVEAGLCEDR